MPTLLKKSLEATGTIGAKLGSLGKGSASRNLKSGVKDKWQNSNFMQNRRRWQAGKASAKRARNASRMIESGGTRRQRFGRKIYQVANGGKILPGMSSDSRKGVSSLGRSLQAEVDKNAREEMSWSNEEISRAGLDQDELRNLALGASVTSKATGRTVTGGHGSVGQKAAIERVVKSGDATDIASLVDNAQTFDSESRKVLADALESSPSRPGFVGMTTVGTIRGMTETSPPLDHKQLIRDEIGKDVYSTEKLAKADKEEVRMVADALYEHHTGVSPIATVDAVNRLVSAAVDAYADPRFGAGKSRKNLENIGTGKPGA